MPTAKERALCIVNAFIIGPLANARNVALEQVRDAESAAREARNVEWRAAVIAYLEGRCHAERCLGRPHPPGKTCRDCVDLTLLLRPKDTDAAQGEGGT